MKEHLKAQTVLGPPLSGFFFEFPFGKRAKKMLYIVGVRRWFLMTGEGGNNWFSFAIWDDDDQSGRLCKPQLHTSGFLSH